MSSSSGTSSGASPIADGKVDKREDDADDDKEKTARGEATKFSMTTIAFSIIAILGDVVMGLSEAAKDIHENVDPENSLGIEGEEAQKKLKEVTKELVKITDIAHDKMKAFSDMARKSLPPSPSPAKTGGAEEEEGKAEEKKEEKKEESNDSGTSNEAAKELKENLKKTTDDAEKLAQEETKKGEDLALKKGEEIASAGMKYIMKLYETGVGYAVKYGVGLMGESDILEVPYDELNSQFNNELTTLSTFLNDAATNPESREAIKELAKALAVTAVVVMDDVKPELEKVTDNAVNMVENMTEKGTRGATATMISIVQSFLAEIPWVGGVIDIMIAMGKGFNTAAEVFRIFVSRNTGMFVSAAKGVKKTEDAIEKGSERIMSALNKVKDLKSKNTEQKGGGGSRRRSNKKRSRSRKSNVSKKRIR